VADPDVIAELEERQRVVFRYVDEHGEANDDGNANGSVNNIAGIINEHGNVLGLMPHPERSVEALLGSNDGLPLFESLAERLGSGLGSSLGSGSGSGRSA
jgi:phosphoribosylformylglycinamidine synthase subunit PurQ / glutaminase